MMLRTAVLLLPGLLLAGLCRLAAADAVDRYVLEEMQRQQIPGMAVGLFRDGEAITLRSYGMANLEHQVPVTPDTLFQTGSIGKSFTALGVMRLVERGRLSLDASVRTWFKGAPASWQPITVRHLLNHTAGLGYWRVDEQDDYTDAQLLARAFAAPLAFPAGQRFEYNNMGYALLGILMTQVTGEHYGTLLRDEVFQPLGMSTARVISDADIIPHRAAGYELKAGRLLNQAWVSPTFNATADGSLYLSLRDYARWDLALAGRRLLSTASWLESWAPVTLADGSLSHYGFGWQVETRDGKYRLSHSGGWQGFSTHFQRDEARGRTLVVLVNRDRIDTGVIAARIDALLPQASP